MVHKFSSNFYSMLCFLVYFYFCFILPAKESYIYLILKTFVCTWLCFDSMLCFVFYALFWFISCYKPQIYVFWFIFLFCFILVGVSTPGGSLDRRVNCRRVSQPRWVGARQSTKGGETAKGKPAAFVLSCAQVGCACSRGLQASAREGER
jgi:hypothetical protein